MFMPNDPDCIGVAAIQEAIHDRGGPAIVERNGAERSELVEAVADDTVFRPRKRPGPWSGPAPGRVENQVAAHDLDAFPALFQFFGGWFNQDWDLDAADDDGVIRRFLEEEAPEQVAAAREQLSQFLELDLDEAAMKEALARDFGCDYNPAADGFSVTEWVHKVAARLS